MYRVIIFNGDNIAERISFVDSPITSQQERELLEPFPDCYLDISKVDPQIFEDRACWSGEDYFNHFQEDWVNVDGNWEPDYWSEV